MERDAPSVLLRLTTPEDAMVAWPVPGVADLHAAEGDAVSLVEAAMRGLDPADGPLPPTAAIGCAPVKARRREPGFGA